MTYLDKTNLESRLADEQSGGQKSGRTETAKGEFTFHFLDRETYTSHEIQSINELGEIHETLSNVFPKEELDPLHILISDLTGVDVRGSNYDIKIGYMRDESGEVVAVRVAYLLEDGGDFYLAGAYLAIKEGNRGTGIGRKLLTQFNETVKEHLETQGETLSLYIGEAEESETMHSVGFWLKAGYSAVNVDYEMPHLSLCEKDFRDGVPITPNGEPYKPITDLKLIVKSADNEVTPDSVRSSVKVMMDSWYLPRKIRFAKTPEKYFIAKDYAEKIIEKNLSNLDGTLSITELVDGEPVTKTLD
jgi:GNAT superfamily N-acetyltransferase